MMIVMRMIMVVVVVAVVIIPSYKKIQDLVTEKEIKK